MTISSCSRRRFLHAISLAVILASLTAAGVLQAADQPGSSTANPAPRERLLMDFGWRFAFGHPNDTHKDFDTGTGYFSYLAKSAYGDGAARPDFDDRAWRLLDLPHDWAVEAPFSPQGSHSHGYKAAGRNFPEASVGWYRKTFFVPQSDLGRRISIEFDGIYRDSKIWINGHYLGNEPSGYSSIAWNVSEFLNYGGDNVVAVRVDASMEEGWFYEGAGIYRHSWLVKTEPLHVARYGTFVSSEINNNSAEITARVKILNEGTNKAAFDIEQSIEDADGKIVVAGRVQNARLDVQEDGEWTSLLMVSDPKLWSIDSPHLYRLWTTLRQDGKTLDRYETPFGIRTVRFDPNEGFFLNGHRVELKGANMHQDHAGVGVAIPDALQEYRIARLKTMGCNAYRCSHNPPTPELLDACDRLGMVVIDENRLMGTSEYHLDQLKRMILRDRNHPSVILWSLGNEEWGIEGNEKGARITSTMQAYAQRLDPTRRTTVAISGGWGGSSTTVDVVGYNYIHQSNPDKQHAAFPNQPGVGTEETTTQQTRGVYEDDRPHAHVGPLAHGDSGGNCEVGWQYYAARPFLAGLFYWTGFDYRGEPTPFGYPAISSQFGLMDACGFAKDSYYYLKSWWTDGPVVHVFPHWNWPGKEGQTIQVFVDSNCEEVELLLNGRNLGRKPMQKNSHVQWDVAYNPGELLARGFNGGKEMAVDRVITAGAPAAIRLEKDRDRIKADAADLTVMNVQIVDAQGRFMPVASNDVAFHLQGPAKIIGVGNGDPSSHEPDRYFDRVSSIEIANWRELATTNLAKGPETEPNFDDAGWPVANGEEWRGASGDGGRTRVYRGAFELPQDTNAILSLFLSQGGERASIYLNGRAIGENLNTAEMRQEYTLDPHALRPGRNVLAIVTTYPARRGRNSGGRPSGSPAIVKAVTPAGEPHRKAFNGLAQVIVQS
ncbi:MAG TPA: beta-galactosidase GalA, partial [Verrucomicrobiae bacterium]|nr:beta-galactosidase GalA [Verrucomicrobiae bacterium]